MTSKLLLLAAAGSLVASSALAANPLPMIPGAGTTTPSALIGYDSSTSASCIIGMTPTCSLQIGGGGGGGGAVTAASGSYAAGALSAGAIVDLGTGGSPGANTTNGILKSLLTALGTPFQAAGSIGNTAFGISQTTPGVTNGVTAVPGATSAVALSDAHCTVVCASIITTGAHNLYGFGVESSAAGWLLAFDATSCPANGTVTPIRYYSYSAPTVTQTASWGDLPMKQFGTGIALCFSTTGPFTMTASTTAALWMDYK